MKLSLKQLQAFRIYEIISGSSYADEDKRQMARAHEEPHEEVV